MEKEPYYGDLEKTQILHRLFQQPAEQRDEAWTNTLLENIADASFACGEPQVIQGPDGYPYFELDIPEQGKPFTCFVIRHLKDDYLLENGFGIVIHPSKSPPDWVFTYGDIVNFHLTNAFYSDVQQPDLPAQEVLTQSEQVLVGQPSEDYLPLQTRSVLKNFFNYHGLENVRILLMQRHGHAQQELVLNITPEQCNSQAHYEQVMGSIGWFLPRHYTYVAMDEKDLRESFAAL